MNASLEDILSAAALLLLVIDPAGNVPVFLSLLSSLEPRRARQVLVRELVVALAFMLTFLFAGRHVLRVLQIDEPALGVSGGIILFLIALQMIFSDARDIFGRAPEGEPFIVPLAVPLIAGPSALTTILLLAARNPGNLLPWLVAILLAWSVSGAILLSGNLLRHWLGGRGLAAVQRLMGMLLTTVAVQMFLRGLQQFFAGRPW